MKFSSALLVFENLIIPTALEIIVEIIIAEILKQYCRALQIGF